MLTENAFYGDMDSCFSQSTLLWGTEMPILGNRQALTGGGVNKPHLSADIIDIING